MQVLSDFVNQNLVQREPAIPNQEETTCFSFPEAPDVRRARCAQDGKGYPLAVLMVFLFPSSVPFSREGVGHGLLSMASPPDGSVRHDCVSGGGNARPSIALAVAEATHHGAPYAVSTRVGRHAVAQQRSFFGTGQLFFWCFYFATTLLRRSSTLLRGSRPSTVPSWPRCSFFRLKKTESPSPSLTLFLAFLSYSFHMSLTAELHTNILPTMRVLYCPWDLSSTTSWNGRRWIARLTQASVFEGSLRHPPVSGQPKLLRLFPARETAKIYFRT